MDCGEARFPRYPSPCHHWEVIRTMPVISNPTIMMGKPTIKGTLITVESILERLAAGESEVQIMEANPRLSANDIRDALHFAARAMHADVLYPTDADAA